MFGGKTNCVKSDKVRIATKQDTVNNDFYRVKRTCVRAYISETTNAAASYGNACTIGILILRSDLTHNHGVENFLLSIMRYIFKYNDAESICDIKRVVSWGPLTLFQLLGIVGQVHWRRMCSICAQTSGACLVGGTLVVALRFCRGQALSDFGETGIGIVIWPPGLE